MAGDYGAMRVGFGVPVSGSWATPQVAVALSQQAERLGYASLWTFQRLLCPLDADQPRLAPQYRAVHDPLAMLAYLAGQTATARLGVAVVNLPYYAPILLAKTLTTLDHLSGGRLDVGLGLGWSAEEFAAVGSAYERRGARGEDHLAALREIWTRPVVDYAGEFTRVPRSLVEPKPLQRPHPPVLLGGSAPAALRRAGRLADGWVSSSQADLSRIEESIAQVRAGAEEAGRDPKDVRVVVRGVAKVRSGERGPLVGSLDEIRGDLADLAGRGVSETFVDLNFDPQIGSPDADAGESVRRAGEVLDALAP